MTALRTPTRILQLLPTELSLAAVLRNGQCFRWNSSDVDTARHWSIGWRDRTLLLHQDANALFYSALYPLDQHDAYHRDLKEDTTLPIVRQYLSLDVSLSDLYAEWSRTDRNFVKQTSHGRYGGIRVLKQDPWETLVGFISSSNNNIGRISLMIRRLCESLGAPLPVYNDQLHYAFPSPEDLCRPGTEELLRELGFGYRAPYIYKTALLLCELASEAQCTPHEYLDSLSKLPYTEARAALLQFVGVGPKVADCVALFGLGFAHVVPVDTHVWQIAVRDYGFKGKEAKGPCGAAVYEKVQQHLQGIWGDKAGWAQQILFTADLASFANFVDPLTTPKKEFDDSAAALLLNPYPTPEATPVKVELKIEETQELLATPTRKRSRVTTKVEVVEFALRDVLPLKRQRKSLRANLKD